MKLQRICIRKLFGTFNHDIPLNNDAGVTIVIGENGLGKTVLLEMIEAFFSEKFDYFSNIMFEKFTIEFDDHVVWHITKNQDQALRIEPKKGNKKIVEPYIVKFFSSENLEQLARRVARLYPSLKRVGPRRWLDRRSEMSLTLEDIINRYSHFTHSFQRDLFCEDSLEEKPDWFLERCEQINVSLIETQRLIYTKAKQENSSTKTVERYSNELSQKIKALLTESTTLSAQLDRTYPNRLITRLENEKSITIKQLNKELESLENKRRILDSVGLIVIDKDSPISKVNNLDDVVKHVLMLYVEDSFKKIKIFTEIAEKIKLLQEIINKRFKHKKLFIDKEEGFIFRSTTIQNENKENQIIPLTHLSSGEQNELVLFYRLLFDSKPNSLILIDEPEVSLHISWQKCFIEDLKAITKINNLDVIIATHSPDIIANNWNLKVELLGLE